MPPLRVAFYGPVTHHTGYGSAARAYVHALREARADLSVINLDFDTTAIPTDPLIYSLLNRRIEPDFHLVYYYHPPVVVFLRFSDTAILKLSVARPRPFQNMFSKILGGNKGALIVPLLTFQYHRRPGGGRRRKTPLFPYSGWIRIPPPPPLNPKQAWG